MNTNTNTNTITQEQIETSLEQKRYIAKVYGWMTLALLVTGLVAMYTVSSITLLRFILGSNIVFYGLIIGELILVGRLAANVEKMSAKSATITFLVYSALNGLTISVIFLVYTLESIASTFLITALTFGVMSIYGYVTKKDLTSFGNLLFMGLVGIVIASFVNMFFHNETVYWVTTFIGIFVFVGLTAYDTQKIKQMSKNADENVNLSIKGALTLYLDFINLLLLLLRIVGRKRK